MKSIARLRVLAGLCAAALACARAQAGEVVTTAGATTAAPSAAAPAVAAPLRVQPSQATGPAAGAPAPPARCRDQQAVELDRQPHGEVWAGAGTHGYREVGTAMTAPVGKCGSVSIAIDRTQSGGLGWRR